MQRSSRRRRFFQRNASWKNRLKILIPLSIFLAYLSYLLLGSYGFINIIRLKREEVNLREKKKALLEEKVALLDSLEMIREDSFALERLAREKLMMVKPGDEIILLEE
ncbi:septum formation initiator family protein [candidate division WOR-3 bacterium]|nr:septum formation initiator family protein [candidate division WOR-3 bacterium]MCK4528585.1 septum formation initiator family protein [candidate division WOR-3 bacterium]